MDSFDIYIPAPGSHLRAMIDAGSGIVGTPAREWMGHDATDEGDSSRIVIDYEGNRFRAAHIVTFADRVSHAADRHQHHYPTVARSMVDRQDLVLLGRYSAGRVYVAEPLCVRDWLGTYDEEQMHVSSRFVA